MATQMPIEQDYDRHIDGMEMTENEDGSVDFDMPPEDMELEELPDGSVIVHDPDFKGPSEDKKFYENLAEVFDVKGLALEYINLIEKDKEARKMRDKQYEDGIKRTGMGNDSPGGATFFGASKVVHPVMAESCVDFASRAIKEMFPPDGPVRTKILGEVDEAKTERAERKRDYMNWQLTEQIEEFRDEQEQLLTQLPLGGSQYLKLWYDEHKKRPCVEFLPIDRVIVPFAASNFYTAQRATEVHEITEWEVKMRIKSGMYRDISMIRATMEPEPTGPQKANDKIEGKKWQDNEDGVRSFYHTYVWLEREEDDYSKGEMAPYILMIDSLDHEVVGLYRNWEDGDETKTKLDWVVEFKFIPWRGAYAVGLPHLIGGLSAALTGALRALLDTAHINNSATMLKLKGAKVSGQSQQVEVTQVAEIEAGPGINDIRQIAMPMPFNPPSAVLFELLGWLDNAAKGVITTAEEKIADVTAQAPVGTTQALIEQGSAVFSAIHARLHESQGRVLKILGRLNRWYLDDQRKGEVVKDLDITKEDFERNTDVVPVSDPHIFSETQRMAQSQAVMALMDKYPNQFKQKAVLERFLKQMKVPGINELMVDEADDKKKNPAQENVDMSMGEAAIAYPEQDHLSHFQTHFDYLQNPLLGGNPIIGPSLVAPMIEHLRQHMTMWYLQQMKAYATKSDKEQARQYEDPKLTSHIDKLFALASQHVGMDTQNKVFAQLLPDFQHLMQLQQQYQQQAQQQPLDPDAQALIQTSMAETQRRTERDKQEMALKNQQLQQQLQIETSKNQAQIQQAQAQHELDIALNSTDNLTKERIASAELTRDAAKLQQEQYDTAISLQNEAQRHLGGQHGE